jgi:signal transduction histidine kinase
MRHLPLVWQENLLHIGQEALTNALKYAHPRNFETRLTFNTKELRLQLRDDGDGFKIKDRHDGFGLAGMRERVEQMGGTLKINSARGKGTDVTVVLLLNGESIS